MKKMRICAFICALAVSLSVTGCADTTWVLKDGNITIPTGVYNYFLLYNANTVQQMASSAAAASVGTKSSASQDMWSQTVSNTNAATWAMNTALDNCKQLVVIEKLCASRKVALTAAQKASASSDAASTYGTSSGMMSKNGIAQSSLERIYNDYSYLDQALFGSYYGSKGDKAVSESELTDYYKKNYVHVRQIFVAKIDTTSSSYKALTGAKLTAATKKANEAYAALKADAADNYKNFDTIWKKYNEDTKQTKVGYTFSKATASSYDTKFTNLGFSLKEGEVGMAESDMGYFIEYKLPVDTGSTAFTANVKQGVLSAMKGPEFIAMLKDQVKKETFVQNDNTLNRYSPKKLDLSAS